MSFMTAAKSQSQPMLQDAAPALHIAIVSETWPPEINGVSFSMLQLAKGLQQRGHSILLIRPQQKNDGRISVDFRPDMECLVKAQAIPKYNQLQFGMPQIFKIGQAFDTFKPDIVHIVTEGPLGLAALNQAKMRDVPVSSGFHSSFHDFSRHFDLAFLLRPIQQYFRWFHNNTDLTCVPSEYTRDMLQQFGVTCPMQVVGRGVDGSRFHPRFRDSALRRQWQADDQTTVLLSVGRVSPEKELPVIFQAYAQLKHHQPTRKFKMVVVGDGPSFKQYQQDYPDVIFMGAQVGEALSKSYASGDVFMFPSRIETFGNVALEAMASGLPVLGYDYACVGQMVEQGISGWKIPFDDVTAWQQQVLDIPDLDALNQMGKHAAAVAAQYGWNRPVNDFEHALINCVKRSELVVSL